MLGISAISEGPIAARPDSIVIAFVGAVMFTSVSSDDAKIYAATEDYITRGTDTPPGQPFLATLMQLPRFDRSIVSGDGFDGLTNGWGSTTLINAEGTYDDLHRFRAVDGREVVYRVGSPDDVFANFFDVARLIATSITVDGQAVVIGHRDRSFLLDVPTQPNKYEGIGDLEGGSDLKGKAKPLCLGRCKNIPAVLVIPAELVLQVNDGPVSAISAVYDKGYPLTFSADYATPTLLRAAAIAGGSYATCVAYGFLRPGAEFEQITCNVNGDASNSGYVETTGTSMRRIIALTGCISDPGDFDTGSFADLEATQPAPIGYFLGPDSTETVGETLNKLIKGIRGWCGFTRLGMLQAGVFTAPTGTPDAEYADLDIIGEINVEQLPSAFYPPPHRVRCAYERNWTIIEQPYAGVVVLDPARAAWLATPYKVASTSQADSESILEDHLLAQDPPVRESYFALEVDALADAQAAFDLANSGYQLYQVQLKAPPFTHDIGQVVRLTLDPARLGFGDGRLLRIPAISDIPENNTIELRVFG